VPRDYYTNLDPDPRQADDPGSESIDEIDPYERYEELLDPVKVFRKARKPLLTTPGRADGEADPAAEWPSSLRMTYRPARHEAAWLLSSLGPFYDQQLIRDVLAAVRGGKEANVYRCEGGPAMDGGLVAAKVYRPRQFRNLRNDKMYKDGRPILTAEGRPVKGSDDRIMRAVGKKTDFGVQVEHTSWLMYEYTTLERLHHAGAAVPRPFAAGENALLMGYVGDSQTAAPALSQVSMGTVEAEGLFLEVVRNIELLLEHGLIHGDLSAYNILYWEGKITLIDFPQVADCHGNSRAAFILERDVTRVCEYFARQGVRCDPVALMTDLWSRYGPPEEHSYLPEPGFEGRTARG
jgi:RIO kinase 1